MPLASRSPGVATEDLEQGRAPVAPHTLIPVPGTDENSPPVPAIACTPASPSPSSEVEVDVTTETSSIPYIPPTRRQRTVRLLSIIWHVLFPTLHNFRSKSLLGMVAAIFAAPAVMALTLTLPVVVTDHEAIDDHGEKLDGFSIEEFNVGRSGEGRLVDFEEEGVGARTLVAESVSDDEESEVHELKFNKWLMATQCAVGPLFCVSILFGE